MAKSWGRPRSPWRDDDEFVALAQELWPEDLKWAERSYDKGAVQKLRLRWEGWRAARYMFESKEEWRYRWLVTEGGNKLHRVVKGDQEDDEFVGVRGGSTACGMKKSKLFMPGLMERTALPRCFGCCRATGVPEGRGAPFNEGIDK